MSYAQQQNFPGGGGTGTVTPAGPTNAVQTNNSGSLGGDATLTHSSATAETDVSNLGAIRYVTPSWKWSYVDSGGSLGSLSSAGAGLTITLPCTALAPCPRGLDTTFSAFFIGNGGITSGQNIVTLSSGTMFANYVSLVITIPGAGPAGAALTSTIVSWTDATHAVIATNASNTVSGQAITLGSYIYRIRISGTGTAEAAVVTGGTCTALATSSCTLVISTANAHPNGYTLASASDGIQEAINDAWTADTESSPTSVAAPYVKLMAGTLYNVYGTVYQRGRGSKIDGKGGMIECFTRDYCIFTGIWRGHPYSAYQSLTDMTMVPGLITANIQSCGAASYCNISSMSDAGGVFTFTTSVNHAFNGPTNGVGADVVQCEVSTTGNVVRLVGTVQAVTANTFQMANGSATFSAGTYTFGFCRILQTAIEDNGDHVLIDNFNTLDYLGNSTWGMVITNENDQHMMVRGATNRGTGGAGINYPVGAFFYQRTDQGYAGIMNITDAEISNVNCYTGGGNGLVWAGGSVCQAFPVFGIRYFGGLQPAVFGPVYQETAGGTNNPLYGYGAAMGYLVQGGFGQRFVGTFPTGGVSPTFSCSGTAQAQRNYYVQAVNGSNQASAMWYIGSSQANCAGATIPVKWPSVLGVDSVGTSTGAITWNLAVTSGTGTVPPFAVAGASNVYLLFQSAAGVTCDVTGMCSFSDTQGATSSHGLQPTQFGAALWFWPSPFVTVGSTIYADIVSNSGGIVTSSGTTRVSVIGLQCIGAGNQEGMSQAVVECLNGNTSVNSSTLDPYVIGTVPSANTKGWKNWGPEITNFPSDLWTIVDSNFTKSAATQGFRPSNDAADMAVGEDQAGGYSTRAQTSQSRYINSLNDNAAFKERLTSAFEILAVPLQAGGSAASLSGTGACATFSGQVGGKWSGSVTCTGTTGAATFVITPGGTAPNGWMCSAYDETTRANLLQQTAHNTTTCTLTATSVTQNDVVVFRADNAF